MEDAPIKVPIPVQAIQQILRGDDFVSRYANNFQLESSSFDLKMIFGLLDQSAAAQTPPKVTVEQHTSINLAWPEAKLFIYFLQVHLAGYESANGKVKIPTEAIPPDFPTNPPPPFDTPQGRAAFDIFRKIRAEFVASLNQP